MRAYTTADFAADVLDCFCRRPPGRCPECGRTGFFGPRYAEEDNRKYRLCKFCGFYQQVAAEPEQLRPCVHACGKVPLVAGHPYITWVGSWQQSFDCDYCGSTGLEVEANPASVPAHDSAHPWWNVPASGSWAQYREFWANNGAPERVYL